MKKSLAVICALAVLLTSICGTFMLASANDTEAPSLVVMPTHNGVTLDGGTTDNLTTVVPGGKAGSVPNTANLPFMNLFEITNAHQAASSSRDINITPAAGKGAIFYVEAPDIGAVLRLGVYVIHENGTAYRYGDGSNFDWFALQEGDTEWKIADVINYGVDVSGFKGYIYIPFVRLSQNTAGVVTTGSKITAVRLYNETNKGVIPESKSLKISAPVIVAGDVDASASNVSLPSTVKVTDGVNEYRYFAEPEPVYDSIPKGVSIVEVAQFKAPLTVGMTQANIPTAALNTSVSNNAGFNVEIVNSVGISGKPAIKVTGGTGANDASLGLPTMYFKENAKQASALMFYIDSTDAERKYYPVMGTKNPEGSDQYTQTYNGKVWIMAEGATEWTQINISAYYFTLPAGFKGSVKLDYTNYKFYYGPDVASVHQLGLTTIGPIADGDSITVGNPVHITRDGFTNEFIIGAIVDGNTNEQLGQIDGVVETPPVIEDTSSEESSSEETSSDASSDVSSDTSSDNTSSTPSEPSQPDYKVDPYTGPAIDYSGLNIQNVTVGKLNDVVTVGAAVSEKAAKPAANTTITAVDSKLGITKYPSFKLNSTSVSFTLDKSVAPKNPAEVMYYIELPEGKEASIMPTWNFYNAEGKAYYNIMYSGTAYLLAEGGVLWENTPVSAYEFKLPAGFKGYVKFEVKKINSQDNSPAGDKEVFLADTEKYLNNTALTFKSGIEAVDDVYISAPLFVTKAATENGNVAFVDGETNAARNLFTGAVVTRAELDVNDTSSDSTPSEDTSSGSTSSDNTSSDNTSSGGSGAAPDYKLPAYTGADIDYSDLDIMKVTVGKLKGVITSGGSLAGTGITTAKGGSIVAIPSVNKLTNYPSFKVNAKTNEVATNNLAPGVANFSFDKSVSPKNATELLYYVEMPSDKDYTVSVQWNFYSGNDLAYYNTIVNGNCYILKDGETEWTSVKISLYQFQLPAGFKGYIKFNVKDISTQKNSPAYVNAVDTGVINGETTSAGVYFANDTTKYLATSTFGVSGASADKDIIVSTPLIVTDTGVIPNVAFVDGETNAARNIFTGAVVTRDDLKDYLGQDDGSDTPSDPSSPSDPSAPAQPDYKVQYNGAAIDYTDIDIMKVIVGKLKGVVKIGGDLTDVGASTAQKGTIEAIESANKLTNYPSFKINAQTSKAPLDGLAAAVANFTLDKSVSPKNPRELLYYVEVPSDKDMKATVTWNFYSENGLAYYNTMYNGTCSILKEGETEWKELKISLYKFTLPAGFKGYIKFKTDAIGVQSNSPAYVYAVDEGLTDLDVKQFFKADTTKYLATTAFCLSECSEDMDVIVSVPLFVVDNGAVPNVAFVDGETKAAYNIFTGEVATRDSLKDYIGVSGGEMLEAGEAPEINYNIPKYTGTKYEYGNYEFARVRQFVLAKNIAKGYVISLDSFSDGHPDGTNEYTKLIDTTLGISKMPLFSITKTTGKPNSKESVSLGVWHPDPKVEANAGPGAIMQYLKLPEGLEKPFVQLTMNFYDKDNMAKNVAPYNGVIYYMDKNSTEWVSAKITAYWFELPKGFDGYILLETKSLKAQGEGGDFAADWTMYNYNVNVANLNNMTVIASAPFWVDKKGDIDYACYLNDETNAVRNIFTGKILKKEDIIKPLQIGDTLVKLPDYTTDFSASIADKDALSSGTAAVKWDSIDNAVKYVVRVFKKVNTDDGIAYNFVAEAETSDTSVTINGLELNTQYAIVVYAYDAKDNEIAVFDYINVSTAGGTGNAPVTKPTTPSTPTAPEDDGFNWILIVIIAAGVLVLAGIAVAVVIILKKRKANVAVGDDAFNDADVNADVNVETETPTDPNTDA